MTPATRDTAAYSESDSTRDSAPVTSHESVSGGLRALQKPEVQVGYLKLT